MTTVPICKSADDVRRQEIGFLLFPFSGAGASLFRDWPTVIAGRRVGAYQLPGRENRIREPLPTSLTRLACTIADELSDDASSLVLAGHCMGGLLAHQVAIELEGANRGPRAVLLSRVQVPENGLYGAFTPEMTDDELVAEMSGSLLRAAKTPVPDMLAKLALRILKSDVAMLTRYHGSGCLRSTPIVVVNWTRDPHVTLEHSSQWAARPGAHVHVLKGFPETFIGSPGPAIELFVDQLMTSGLRVGADPSPGGGSDA